MERQRVRPLDPPMVPFALTGMAIWVVLALVLLAAYGWLRDHGHTDWLWTCVGGVAFGLPGLYLMIRHDRHRRRRRATEAGTVAGADPRVGAQRP